MKQVATPYMFDLSFIKTSYTHNINDLAPSWIGNVPVRFLA